MIRCKCYNDIREFDTKKQAIEFFRNCAFNSEGSEQSRYINILEQLYDGCQYCSDDTTI